MAGMNKCSLFLHPKTLSNLPRDITSEAEASNEWLCRELWIAWDNSDSLSVTSNSPRWEVLVSLQYLDLWHSLFRALCSQCPLRSDGNLRMPSLWTTEGSPSQHPTARAAASIQMCPSSRHMLQTTYMQSYQSIKEISKKSPHRHPGTSPTFWKPDERNAERKKWSWNEV